MTEHSYKYSITRITDDITTVLETDDRAFAYEFTHGMPEIDDIAEPCCDTDVEPDCTNLSVEKGDYPITLESLKKDIPNTIRWMRRNNIG